MINRRSYLGIPLGTRRNRGWLVAAYWFSVVVTLAFGSVFLYRGRFTMAHWWISATLGGLIGTMFIFLGGSRQIGPLVDFDGDPTPPSPWIPLVAADNIVRWLKNDAEENRIDRSLDERDIRLRNAAHFEAYQVVRRILVPAAFVMFVVSDTILRNRRFIFLPISLLMTLVIYNLPQSLILWWEPDVEELQ